MITGSITKTRINIRIKINIYFTNMKWVKMSTKTQISMLKMHGNKVSGFYKNKYIPKNLLFKQK